MAVRPRDPLLRMIASLRGETEEVLEERGATATRIDLDRTDHARDALTCWVQAAQDPAAPTLVEFHGGGFALGDARKEDALGAWCARELGVSLVGVNYRLAPEHPFPAAYDDALDAVTAALTQPEALGVGTGPVYVMGYSAGAALALEAALAANARRELPRSVEGALLYYPLLDAATDPAAKHPRDIDLPLELMAAFNTWYVADGDARDPRISPVFATTAALAHAPRTILFPVVGDALAAEADEMAAHLRRAHVDVAVHPVSDAYHGYIEDMVDEDVYRALNLPETIGARPAAAAQRARETLAQGIGELLGRRVPLPAFIA